MIPGYGDVIEAGLNVYMIPGGGDICQKQSPPPGAGFAIDDAEVAIEIDNIVGTYHGVGLGNMFFVF